MPGTAAALLLAAAALALWPGRVPGRVTDTLRPRSDTTPVRPVRDRRPRASSIVGQVVLSAALGCGVAVILGSVVIGAVLGAAALVLMHRSARRAGRADLVERLAELPAAVDLMGLLLRAGAPPATAVTAASTAITGPLAGDLRRIAALQMMGATTAEAWRDGLDDPVLAPIAAAAVRSADSGSALADAWASVAAETRAAGRLRAEVAARRAGVASLAPLGLCFLPAFICLGVVPIVIGLAGNVFG